MTLNEFECYFCYLKSFNTVLSEWVGMFCQVFVSIRALVLEPKLCYTSQKSNLQPNWQSLHHTCPNTWKGTAIVQVLRDPCTWVNSSVNLWLRPQSNLWQPSLQRTLSQNIGEGRDFSDSDDDDTVNRLSKRMDASTESRWQKVSTESTAQMRRVLTRGGSETMSDPAIAFNGLRSSEVKLDLMTRNTVTRCENDYKYSQHTHMDRYMNARTVNTRQGNNYCISYTRGHCHSGSFPQIQNHSPCHASAW